MRTYILLPWLLSTLCVPLFFAACSGHHQTELDARKKSDKELYQLGLEELKAGHNDKARQAFKLVFDNFPKSEYRILAKIGYADSYYYEGTDANYLLAIQEYQDFISLFPFSPKAEYAQFQIGMCHLNMTEKPDRDQTNTRKALEEFRKAVDNYPKGQYYKNAYNQMLSAYSKLAEHDFLIGKYYHRTGRDQACVDRIKSLLKTYPEKVYEPKYYFILAEALRDLSQFKESCFYYSQLMERWPNSEFSPKAQEARTKFCKG